MKKIIVIVTSLFMFVAGIQAQDIVTLKTGEDIQAKVLKISDTEIEYKKWTNQDGPTYSKKLSEVFSVKYQNGEKEVFNVQPMPQPSMNKFDLEYRKSGFMTYRKGHMYINGIRLTDSDVSKMCGRIGYETYGSALNQRVCGKLLCFIGWMTIGAGAYIYATIDGLEGYAVMTIGEAFLPFGYALRGIGTGRLKWVAEEYNRNLMGDNVSVSFSPSIMRIGMPDGNNGFGLGAGVALNF